MSDEDYGPSMRVHPDDLLPGARRGDLAIRSKTQVARCLCVQFSPTGTAWAAATTEGMVVFALDAAPLYDPYDIDIAVTPASTRATFAKGEHLHALMMSLRLNLRDLITEVIDAIDVAEIDIIARNFPVALLPRLIEYLGGQVERTRRVELYARWCRAVLGVHGETLRRTHANHAAALRTLHSALTRHHTALSDLCSANSFLLRYVTAAPLPLPQPPPKPQPQPHVATAETAAVKVEAAGPRSPGKGKASTKRRSAAT
eukprot:TRINITY_DN3035_c0_g1_i2.p1 TRINITY_DN3035_c0_g1~~TRINITY_DN3035_c0_g1_i2.p1  ORF type:complete len:274 (-),score=87.72 TRINITY_DN3035_c0_g1_i2:47-820(-)